MVKWVIYILSSLLIITGIILISGVIDPVIMDWATERIGRPPTDRTFSILKWTGRVSIIAALTLQSYLHFIYPHRSRVSQAVKQARNTFNAWVEKTFGKYIDFTIRSRTISISAFNYQDAIILAFIVLFSIAWYLQRIQTNYPFVFFGSDLANIASFSLAFDQPQLFTKDFILNNVDNFRVYFQLHVLLARLLGSWTNNYSTGILLIHIPTTFLYLSGIYWLGRTVINNRYWALTFMFINLFPLYFAFETWGVVTDPNPRTGIQALLPFLLILVWTWKDTPSLKRWGLIVILTGCLVYIHAVGTPIWMVGIIAGLWTQIPKEWGYKKQALFLSTLAALMLITQSVFISN